MTLGFWIVLLILLAIYLLYPRAYIYIWQEPTEIRLFRDFTITVFPGYWIKVAILRKDGSFLDLGKPLSARRVATFFNQQQDSKVRAVFRLFFPEEEDAGAVEPGGSDPMAPVVAFLDGKEEVVGEVARDGELWLRDFFTGRNVEWQGGEGQAVRFREMGRFRGPRINEITLLAKAQAAFILYREYFGETAEEAPRGTAPKADLGLPSLFLFSLLFLDPSFAQTALAWWGSSLSSFCQALGGSLLHLGPLALLSPLFFAAAGLLAPPHGYTLDGLLLFLLFWLILFWIKKLFVNYLDEKIPERLVLFTRPTGLGFAFWLGAAVTGFFGMLPWLGAAVSPQLSLAQPLLLATALALVVTVLYVPRPIWKVDPWDAQSPELPSPPLEGGEARDLAWTAPLSQGETSFSLRLSFPEGSITQWRQANPFWNDWQRAAASYGSTLQYLVRELGPRQTPVLHVATYIASRMQQESWSRVDTVQAVLSLAQEPATRYELDENCEEIKNTKEYCRSAGETLYDGRGDCDCKTALAATVLRLLGFPVLGLVSADAGHAALAVGGFHDQEEAQAEQEAEEKVYWLEHNGKRYLYCETTGQRWRVGEAPAAEFAKVLARPESRVELA